ncbi:hypothetical protein Dsin_032876 [Dipteronia sinensis]|uniref:Uncharacterized protein n=1 Tax=Dipteronia sinensis TaxID=43782 RepID=A0AAD9Z970_9ROSI|nr:hypothetical protein Dsin_032876 [Dipteronia sinensis]
MPGGPQHRTIKSVEFSSSSLVVSLDISGQVQRFTHTLASESENTQHTRTFFSFDFSPNFFSIPFGYSTLSSPSPPPTMSRVPQCLVKVTRTAATTGRAVVDFAKSLDVQRGKPLREITNKDTIVPIALASLLFCMWGLAYGLLDLMNFHIKVAMDIKREEAAILAAGYYAAYLFVPRLLAGPLIEKCGYRFTMIIGLVLLAIGDFLMSAGAQAYSLPGMVASHFVVGCGVSSLERAANPYAVNCGPRTRATVRILIAQAWAGIGTVIAPFLANAFVFNANSSHTPPPADPLQPGRCLIAAASTSGVHGDLSSVISFYRGLGGCIIGLALALTLVFFRTNWMPEVAEPPSPQTDIGWSIFEHPVCSTRYARLWWGVVANFVNLGCQVTFAQFFMEHMKVNACASDYWAAIYMSFAQIAFVLGRFAAAGLVTMPKIFKPRLVLAGFLVGAVVFCGVGTITTSTAAIACAAMVMFFEAPSFPMIFESATADFDEWTSTAETLMIMSISGGALQPALMGKLVSNVKISKAWWLTTGCFVLVLSYAVANNLIPSFRRSVDTAQIETQGNEQDEEKGPDDTPVANSQAVEDIRAPPGVHHHGYFGGVGSAA